MRVPGPADVGRPRALVNRDTRGFVKIVAEQATGRIVGASMVRTALET